MARSRSMALKWSGAARSSTAPAPRGAPASNQEEAPQERWGFADSRIVFADDGSDQYIFSLKVPGMLTLKENASAGAIVSELAPAPGELVVRKQVPSAVFGTGLSAWLTQRSVQTLVVAGAVTSGCVRASVVDAMSL